MQMIEVRLQNRAEQDVGLDEHNYDDMNLKHCVCSVRKLGMEEFQHP